MWLPSRDDRRLNDALDRLGLRSEAAGVVHRADAVDQVTSSAEAGAEVTALATNRIPSSVVDCDTALEMLRRLVRSGSADERKMARIATDDVLDRRSELTRKLAR